MFFVEIRKGLYRVVSTKGNNHLGGDDFDEVVAKWIKEQIEKRQGSQLMRNACQEAMLRTDFA